MTGQLDTRAAAIAHHANAVRERSRQSVVAAVSALEAAEAELRANREQEKAIRKRRDDAHQSLRQAMTGRSRVLVGSTLITCNSHGGVQIENVDILGDVT